MAICSVIRQRKLGKENMSPDFSCGGLIAGNAQGALPLWTGVGFNEKGQERERKALSILGYSGYQRTHIQQPTL